MLEALDVAPKRKERSRKDSRLASLTRDHWPKDVTETRPRVLSKTQVSHIRTQQGKEHFFW